VETSTPASAPAAFRLALATGETLACDRLLIATGGGGKSPVALAIAQKLGHAIEPPVPSLFTFNVADGRIRGLAGFAVPNATTRIPGTKLRESGPMIITHWGLSGPAVLKISAWGARELHALDYKFPLVVNWIGGKSAEEARAELAAARAAHPRRRVATWNPLGLSQRLWERLARAAGVAPEATWANLPGPQLSALADQATACEFSVTGKSANKDEFVTCGGVCLGEVDFKTMERRVCPGRYFAGEALDIDGITGGYNFQAAWTTARLAGLAMAAR
jgi:predicted Rossmann fold flavoprotein